MDKVLGKYSLIHKIGEGGLADVYLATSNGKPYAVKCLKSELVSDERVVADFIKEVEIATKLDHPNILHIHDQGKIGKTYFAVMELVLGLSVKELIDVFAAKGKTVPIPLALYIVRETSRALHYLHHTTIFDYSDSALFHGDLSPHNLILTQEGSLKLMDFGSSGQKSKLDPTRQHFGKLSYLPADVIDGGRVDETTDIYALAVTTFYLLFGRLPFESKNKYELVEMIKNEPMPLFDGKEILRSESQESALRLFFNMALHKDKNFRFKSAEEFLRSLTRIKFKESVVSDMTAVPYYYPNEFTIRLNSMDRLWTEKIGRYKEPSVINLKQSIQIENLLAYTNRRRHPRVSVAEYAINAHITDSKQDIKIESPIHEISRGGMLLRWEGLQASVGEKYPVVLMLGREYSPISTSAQLLYKRTRGEQYFAGFEFQGLSRENTQLLDRYVNNKLNDVNMEPNGKNIQLSRIFLDVYFLDTTSLKQEFERNIRHGGMYLESDQEVYEGDNVFVRIHFPNTFRRILLKGCVVLVKTETDSKRGVALQLDLKQEQIKTIEKFL